MLKKLRIKRAQTHAQMLWRSLQNSDAKQNVAHLVEKRLRPGTYVKADEDVLVTEIGYVTMAILPARAQTLAEVIVVPGVDHMGSRGFLVLHPEHSPFHSLTQTPEDALWDASAAHEKADAIVAAFGSRAALKAAVRQVPWYTMSKVSDLQSSGLCEWGAHSFLKRFGLYTLTYRVGLPRVLFQMSGAYGDRVTAATILRKQRQRSIENTAGLKAEPDPLANPENERDGPQSGQVT